MAYAKLFAAPHASSGERAATAHARLATASASVRIVVLFLVALHLGLTLFLAHKLNIGFDEACTLHTTDGSISEAFHQAITFEIQAPAYFVFLNVWRTLDGSIFFARLFSVICIALTIVAAAAVSRRFLPTLNPAWLAGAIALHPFAVWAAVEIRVYALVILLTALLLITFFDGFLAPSTKARGRVLFALLALLSLYTHYYLGFLIAGGACALIVLRRWRELRSYLLLMTLVGLCFAPMVFIVYGQMSALAQPHARAVSPYEGLKAVAQRFYEYVLPAEWDAAQFVRRWLVRLGFVLASVVFVREGRRRPAQVALWTIVCVLALLLFVALFLTGGDLMQTRHGATLFLPVILIAFAAVECASRRRSVRAVVAAIAFFFYLTSLSVTYAPLAKAGDWGRVASFIKSAERPGQPVLVFRGINALTLKYHYTGSNTLVPIPNALRFDTYILRDEAIPNPQQLAEAMERVPGTGNQFWLVVDNICQPPNAGPDCRMFEDFFSSNYALIEKKSFFRSEVRLLQRKDESE